MKQAIKHLCIAMISSLALGVSLVACGESHTQQSSSPKNLTAPTNLEFLIGAWSSGETDYTLTWTGDKYASGYKIVIEEMNEEPIEKEVGAFTEEYDLTDYLVSGTTYIISVTALGDGEEYLSSEESTLHCKAETPTKGLAFTKIANGYEVSKGDSGYPFRQILPDLYNGVSVTRIADYGFGLPEGSLVSEIPYPTSIRFPQKLISIGTRAFTWLVQLNYLEIPETVTEIEAYAFYQCKTLKATNIPSKLTRLEDGVFGYCALESVVLPENLIYLGGLNSCNLKEITIPEKVEFIGGAALAKNTSLTEIIIPESVKHIGNLAFAGCTNLEKIEIPESVDHYGVNMLDGTKWYDNQPDGFICFEDKLYSYKDTPENSIIESFPEGITEILSDAFADCDNLVSVTIPEGWEDLKGESIFRDCDSLQTVNLPSTLKRINYGMFSRCIALKEIIIPDSVEYIDMNAFYLCTQLKRIVIPNKVKILENAFACCYNLEEVVLSDNVEVLNGTFGVCKSLKQLTLPSNIKIIGSMLINQTQIESLILPKSIEELDAYAFTNYNNALKALYYCGSKEEWSQIQFYNGTTLLDTSATLYFYSEEEPPLNKNGTDYNGNYWHYADDGTPVVWTIGS